MGSGDDKIGKIVFSGECKCPRGQLRGCYPYPCCRGDKGKQEGDYRGIEDNG